MLDKDALLQAATEQTGLTDFGGDAFQEPLERLVNALNKQGRLNAFGTIRAQMTIASGLSNRLKIHDYLSQHPQLQDEVIERPVFIVGLPRTGTTALHHHHTVAGGKHVTILHRHEFFTLIYHDTALGRGQSGRFVGGRNGSREGQAQCE